MGSNSITKKKVNFFREDNKRRRNEERRQARLDKAIRSGNPTTLINNHNIKEYDKLFKSNEGGSDA